MSLESARPVGPDGYPVPIWDNETGLVDRKVARYWREHGFDPHPMGLLEAMADHITRHAPKGEDPKSWRY